MPLIGSLLRSLLINFGVQDERNRADLMRHCRQRTG